MIPATMNGSDIHTFLQTFQSHVAKTFGTSQETEKRNLSSIAKIRTAESIPPEVSQQK